MSSRPARTPGLVFGVLAAALLCLVATAFSPAQPPPPATAELQPAPIHAIEDAPHDQTSENGLEDGTGRAGGASPTPTSPPGASGAPGAQQPDRPPTPYRCYGSPPRQIADPESPPCVLSTVKAEKRSWRGVTATDIRIAVPNPEDATVFDALLRWFNGHFNLYGRKVVVVPSKGCENEPSELRDNADTIAQKGVFAVVGCVDAKGTEYPFYDRLADKGVISIANRPGFATEAHLAAHHPYEWTFLPTFDMGQAHLAELACSLPGPARYAGPELSSSPRRAGLFVNQFTDADDPDVSVALARLRACGLDPVVARVAIARDSTGGLGYTGDSAQQVSTALSDMRSKGVTTLVVLTHSDTTKQVAQVASSQGYEPEILVSSYAYNDFDLFASSFPSDQARHVFGISTWNKFLRPELEYWYRAVDDADPTYSWPNAPLSYYSPWWVYKPLLTLFAGLQMAGPDLTPTSFARGLQETRWPNPDPALDPVHPEGRVDVRPGQHSYISDASVIWLGQQPNKEYGTAASWCYIGNGTRFRLGAYPHDLPLFDGCQR